MIGSRGKAISTMSAVAGVAIAMVAMMSANAQVRDMRFQSPSGNIVCGLTAQEAFCTIRDYSASFTRQPADCDGDWGNHFYVGPKGKGGLACVTDYRGDPMFTLAYGASLSIAGITCMSSRTGMTCRNAAGGGFTLRRADQRVF